MKGRAPKSSLTGFQTRVTRKPGPKRWIDGTELVATTRRIRISTTGATRLTTVVTLRKPSGGLPTLTAAGADACAVATALDRHPVGAQPIQAVAGTTHGHDLERHAAGRS